MRGCKLNPAGFGLAIGIIWGLFLFGVGLVAYYQSYGRPFVDAMMTLYMGYEPSIKGSILGGVCGLIHAFIMGFLIAWLYNRFTCCACPCCDDTVSDYHTHTHTDVVAAPAAKKARVTRVTKVTKAPKAK